MEAFKEMDRNNDRTLTKEEVGDLDHPALFYILILHSILHNSLSFYYQVKEHLKMEAEKLNVQKEESYFNDVVTDVFRRHDQDADGTLSIKEYNVYEHDELQLPVDIAVPQRHFYVSGVCDIFEEECNKIPLGLCKLLIKMIIVCVCVVLLTHIHYTLFFFYINNY